ncbi:hypothetical protein L1987_06682 [Smallanthus sonchifolius]|uniref:Uncharacterized protein n=1 Tax=Smallanthus sonchifolius TaxID=185202 RepID=A0ACB9JZ08_9ASTR|nr:hypothetical protein L1987_06682 [Smallanthus sonchifolius]
MHFPVTTLWIDAQEKAPAYLASTQEHLCVLVKYARAIGHAHLLSAQASEDLREIINWVYNTQDQRFEVFKGRTEERRSIDTTVDEVLQLPDSDLRRMMELGEANEPGNEGGKHLLLDEFTLTDVKGQKMRCSSKAIFKMASKDIKTLSELPLNNPSKHQRGYVVARIVSNMEKLQQQKK